jgi:hypothetical protein
LEQKQTQQAKTERTNEGKEMAENPAPSPGEAMKETQIIGPGLEPSPSLTPEEVVKIQLNAMKANDVPYQDAGIGLLLLFCSPTPVLHSPLL